MTNVQRHSHVNDSVRPDESNQPAPILGVDSELLGVPVDDKSLVEDIAEIPMGERQEDREKKEENGDEDGEV